ncbi:MAG: hypothetical protein KAY50_04190 [Chitinophagaceae bacterium]|nr:hypothetical protein [Chitinophagaceae bacterium]
MQVFQSWADIVIMLVLAIAYIVTFIAQRNQIRVLRETAQSHADLTNSQSVHIDAFKNMFKPDELEKFIKIKVDVGISESNNKLKEYEEENTKLIEVYCELAKSYFNSMVVYDELHKTKLRLEFVRISCKKEDNLNLRMFELLENKYNLMIEEMKNNPTQ